MDGARFAPSGHNEQSTEFVVIQDRKIIHEIATLTTGYLGKLVQQVKNPISRTFLKMVMGRRSTAYVANLAPEMGHLVSLFNSGTDWILRSPPVLVLFCSDSAWLTFFVGVAIVSVGSAYYHENPNNETLVWDRLPMTIGFMGLFVALLGEYVSVRLGKSLLVPAVLLGFFSVFYWHWFDDLRFYYWIQLIPLLTVPVVMILFRSRYSRGCSY